MKTSGVSFLGDGGRLAAGYTIGQCLGPPGGVFGARILSVL